MQAQAHMLAAFNGTIWLRQQRDSLQFCVESPSRGPPHHIGLQRPLLAAISVTIVLVFPSMARHPASAGEGRCAPKTPLSHAKGGLASLETAA